MEISDYDRHPCDYCGHMIGLHTDSPFGHNPLDKNGNECTKSRHNLVIAKLISWLKDAMSERDAYKKSYEDVCKERDNLLEQVGYLKDGYRTLMKNNVENEIVFRYCSDTLVKIERINEIEKIK